MCRPGVLFAFFIHEAAAPEVTGGVASRAQMNFLRLMPVILSLLLLAAHFYRGGELFLVGASLLMIVLMLFRQPWIPRLLQAALVLGSIEWLWTLYLIARVRIEYGMPWARMSVILGAVALFTALSAMVFRGKKVRERYHSRADAGAIGRDLQDAGSRGRHP